VIYSLFTITLHAGKLLPYNQIKTKEILSVLSDYSISNIIIGPK